MESYILLFASFLAICLIFLAEHAITVRRRCENAEKNLRRVLAQEFDQKFAYERMSRAYEEWRQGQIEAQRAQSELERVRRENIYQLILYVTAFVGVQIERAQLMTKAESPQALGFDALWFYMQVVDKRSEGCQLFVGKTLATAVPFRFESLDRVRMKTNN